MRRQSRQGEGVSRPYSAARKTQTRNTTPEGAPTTRSGGFLDVSFSLAAIDAAAEAIAALSAESASVPDSTGLDRLIQELNIVAAGLERRAVFYDRSMRRLADERARRVDDDKIAPADDKDQDKSSPLRDSNSYSRGEATNVSPSSILSETPSRVPNKSWFGDAAQQAISAAQMPTSPWEEPSLGSIPVVAASSLQHVFEGSMQQRASLIHELAVGEQSAKYLLGKCVGPAEDFFPTLRDVAEYDVDTQRWRMKKQCWKELNVWEYDYKDDGERQAAIERAIRQYDKQRLAAAEPEWQRLLKQEERGKGICLSRLQASLARGPHSVHDGQDTTSTMASFWCEKCQKPFRRSCELKKHMNRHNRPYLCTYENCDKSTRGFGSPNDLKRHMATVHKAMAGGDKYGANAAEPKIRPQKDNFQTHLRTVHSPETIHDKIIDAAHLDARPVRVTDREAPDHATASLNKATASQGILTPREASPDNDDIATYDEFKSSVDRQHGDPAGLFGIDASWLSSPDVDDFFRWAGKDWFLEVPDEDKSLEVPDEDESLEVPDEDKSLEVPDEDKSLEVPDEDKSLEVPDEDKFLASPPLYSAGINSLSHHQSPGIEHLHPTTQPTADAPYTDSGYASVSAIKLDNLRRHEDQMAIESAYDPDVRDVEDDAMTEYSTASSVTDTMHADYIEALADDLFKKIGPMDADQTPQTRVSMMLPELLQAFALKVGHRASTPMHRDVMAFVHRHRREIAVALTKISSKQDDDDAEASTENTKCMSLQERMSLWEKNENVDIVTPAQELQDLYPQDVDSQAGDDEADAEQASDSRLRAYRSFIPSTKAYEWLLTRLRREYRLVQTEPGTMQEIRETILSSLPVYKRISRRASSESVSASFQLDWDIFQFLETQEYAGPPDQVFEGVITLTGSCGDAQATTCVQYMRQTWPLTGEVMVELIKKILSGGRNHSSMCRLSDGTTLSARTSRSIFVVRACGVAVSVAEAGEQLAWLAAALRASPQESGLILCTPVIATAGADSAVAHVKRRLPRSADVIVKILVAVEEAPRPLPAANGQCWHDMFKSPVVVRGYPIPRRSQSSTGLEIPLNIMAGLAQARRLDRFDDKVYIKGFSTMLVPTRLHQDVLCWHLVYNKDGSRISYLDGDLDQDEQISHVNIEDFRHVLGWCAEAHVYAGSKLADETPVRHSRLPKPHTGCALANKSVCQGKIISSGPDFELGAKDKAVRVSRGGYIPLLEWLATRFVLLWDEADKRGWLVNGTSALLHIVRSSLAHDRTGDFSSAFLSPRLQESDRPGKVNSAIHVLINRSNLDLKLYREKDGYILLESRIDTFCNILEKLFDFQSKMAKDPDVKWSDRPRRHLEGWEFEDLARRRDPMHPRVATLDMGGKSWVDFTRAIQAITLVGRGFGEIIRPAAAGFCQYWAKLPPKQYYLAACLSDLQEVVKEHGRRDDGHVQLGDDLLWHTPTTVFVSCRCEGDAPGADHCEPVQTIFPSALATTLGLRKHTYEDECGGNDSALIFGHHSHFSWVWGDTGHPQEGVIKEAAPCPKQPETGSDSVHDSGIGSMLSDSSSSSTGAIKSPSDFANNTRAANWAAASIDGDLHAPRQYTVGILCALPKELMAVRALLDRTHAGVQVAADDSNQYALGQMAQHMVVTACLPAGEYGTNAAAAAASNMARSFPCLRFCLLVGIGGGAPSDEHDIRLGDVVVGLPAGTRPGVIQYDLGKEKDGSSFELTGTLQRPPRVLATAISAMRSDPQLRCDPLGAHLARIASVMAEYSHPGSELDVLQTACAACRSNQMCPLQGCHERRRTARRTGDQPAIHYGLIASGNRLVKDAAFRDRIAREVGALCFEMEAAGVVNTVPCLVVRGICDYCDAFKNDVWQEYAAAAAAAYAKVLLGVVAAVDDGTDVAARLTESATRLQRRYQPETWELPSKRRKM